MAPRGRGGSFRGRGSRGRGGRGRGGGRTFSKYGPQRRFDNTRTADVDEEESDEASSASEPEDVDSIEEDDGSEDETEQPAVKPYMALLQGLNDSNAPSAKRRKIEHSSAPAPSKLSQPTKEPAESSEDEEMDGDRDVDEVEEAEDPAIGADEEPTEDSDDEIDATDPFDSHFANADEQLTAKRVEAAKKGQWTTKRTMLQSWRATLMGAGDEEPSVPPTVAGIDQLKLKQKLRETASKKKMTKFNDVERALAPALFDYRDILHCDRSVKNSQSMRQLVCLHALNHIFKTRDRVIKNNHKLAKEGEDAGLDLRDQGFTRPKVLFILPTRNSCARMVNVIRDLCDPDQQENRKRFDDAYVDKDSKFGDDRPADFRDLFEGSDDDMFRIGVKFTRKTVKYFSQFYNSDMLFASPLGLRMAIGSEEDTDKKSKKKNKKTDYDFLSSVEMVVVDQADALLMQNWEHVEYIFEHLNLQPRDAHDCDFGRVRGWYLEGWARHFRQTVVLSAFNTPELAELQRTHGGNWAGRVRLQPEYPGTLQALGVKARQTFSRFQAPSADRDPDARFAYFTTAVVPSLVKRAKDATGTLVFVPSYLDFVRVRNYFANSPDVGDVTFGAISEYADVPEASRARSHFLSGRHRVLLYTERAHHFRRYQLGGVHRVVFYGLPDNPVFYQEIAGGCLGRSEQDMRIEPGRGSVRVMFSKYDVMKLERIAGSKRVGKMIQERGDTFDFV